ncbi:MAG: hypothetical protein GY820_22635 [Gammaproteobacteria bacterium]|nr:hypothetical protein [Gammaproteobacteria bacterium]
MSFAGITDGVQLAASPDNLRGFDVPVADVEGVCAVVISGAWELLAIALAAEGEGDFLTAVYFGFSDTTFTDEVAAFA